MDLVALAAAMAADGLLAGFEPATEELPADRVVVQFPVDGLDEPVLIQVTEIEHDRDAMSGLDLFQVYAPIPTVLDDDEMAEAIAALPEINASTPLIGFSVSVEERFPYFRYVGLVPAGDEQAAVVVETVWLAGFALEQHAATFLESADE